MTKLRKVLGRGEAELRRRAEVAYSGGDTAQRRRASSEDRRSIWLGHKTLNLRACHHPCATDSR